MFQVIHHQQSTDRQYALHHKAVAYGWPEEQIKILDGDLGQSGAQGHQREDFKLLVADVSMGKVGAIFILEASRLSRCSSDWNRLLELCALTHTLLIDEDGIYDPALFNDQLLLGLKGTMSQAELHLLRARLHGAKVNKARKGELRFPLPIGYCYLDEKEIIFDEDAQVRSALHLLFSTFHQTQSVYGLVQYFGKNNIDFPKRAYGGHWKGKVLWGRLTYSRALSLLKHPFYAGVYTYGRYKSTKKISPDGQIQHVQQKMPMENWEVMLKGHHPAYISWETYEKNQLILAGNQTNTVDHITPSPVREGCMLLQGVLLCGKCGRRVSLRYKGNGGKYPTYECNWRKKEGLTGNACLSIRSDWVDKKIEARVLQVLSPENVTIATKALQELEKRNAALDKHWELNIQRASYQASLAERRYEEVDPANRLVAMNLEKKWEDALVSLATVKEQYEQYKQKMACTLSNERKNELLALAGDIPHLWHSTKNIQDKKRIIRLLIKDITVSKDPLTRDWLLQLRWQGGAHETLKVRPLPKIYDRQRYAPETIEKVKALARQMDQDGEIVQALNEQNYLSATHKAFTKAMVKWVRYKHRIPLQGSKQKDEFTPTELMHKFGISRHMVYYWIERGYVKYRKLPTHQLLIAVNANTEMELWNRIKSSYKLKHS
jgi:DNA invertase Pin-like site-specific DNA recombinase